MLKRILFASTLFSTAAIAQQVDINGKDFLSGAGDARLEDIARQAAASGKKLVVTAPQYWQGKVAAKLHAGAANASVQMSEGFFENVLVRIDDGKAAPAKADAATAEAPKADSAKADAAKATAAKADATKAEAARAEAAKAEAARAETARIEAEKAEAARAEIAKAEAAKAEAARVEAAKAEAARAEAAKAEAAKAEAANAAAAKAKAESDRIAQIKQRMEKNLNDGKPADGSLTVAQLQKDDLVFVDGSVRGVARRSGAHTQLYWLDGDLNLERAELLPVGENRYKVSEPVRNVANPTLRAREVDRRFVSAVPPPDSTERKALQQKYSEGHDISGSLHTGDLRQGDILYVGSGAVVVSRRSGLDLQHYWLDGEVNLGQTGIIKQAGNAYQVMTDTIR
jgi:chemotaxis protein histidine kinase CheA